MSQAFPLVVPPGMSEEQRSLLDRALGTVRNYLRHRQLPPHFAFATDADGAVVSFLPADPPGPASEALQRLLAALTPQARAGHIRFCVIVSPMPSPPEHEHRSAIFDLEERGQPRFVAALPFLRGEEGVDYGPLRFRQTASRLFA